MFISKEKFENFKYDCEIQRKMDANNMQYFAKRITDLEVKLNCLKGKHDFQFIKPNTLKCKNCEEEKNIIIEL